MTSQEILLLIILAAVSFLLIQGRIRPDLTGLLALTVVGLTGLVTPQTVFSGFGSSAVITILAISIVSEGLHQSGVTKYLGRQMFRLAKRSEPRLVFVTVISAALLSLFMNNIAAAGVLMPAVIALSRQTRWLSVPSWAGWPHCSQRPISSSPTRCAWRATILLDCWISFPSAFSSWRAARYI